MKKECKFKSLTNRMIYIAVFLIPAIPDDTACLEVMSITNFSRHLDLYNMSKVFRQRLKNNWFEKNRFSCC